MNARLEALRQAWDGLTEREKRLVRILGGVAAALVILLPMYLLSSAIGSLESQNEEIAAVLSEIGRAEERLAQREAEREAAEARYAQRAPELGTFLEGRSSARQMTIDSVTNQPEVQEGRFRKRHVRASFPRASLRQVVRLMTDIESAPYPVAIERVHIEHFQEGDHYNLELGVVTFDRQGGAPGAAGAGGAAGADGVGRPVSVRPPGAGPIVVDTPGTRVQPPGTAGPPAPPP
jgi:hypothetical protein